jgi:long-chain fatty acid transport protein
VKKLFTLVLACVLFAGSLFAGGFQINENGARAMAMAGAFTGLANDPSAVYFNPAGILQLKGTNFYFGSTLIAPKSSFTDSKSVETKMDSQLFTPINFYLTHGIGDKLAVGLGVNNQYGLGTKWDPSSVIRFYAGNTSIKSFFFTPVVAYQWTENLSISAGLAVVYADVEISKKSPAPIPGYVEPTITMKGNKTGFGFSAGLLYKFSQTFQAGLSYRSQVKLEFAGTATSDPATFYHPLLKANLAYPNGDITAPLNTPQNVTLGIAYKADPSLMLTADFQYVGWSSYDKLAVTFTNYDLDLNPANGVQNVSSVDRNYQNTWILRTGAEYTASDKLSVRAGILYDRNPVQTEYVDPTLPDADRLGLNIGFGYKISSKIAIDVAYMFLAFDDRNLSGSKVTPTLNGGMYQNSAHLIGVDFSYSL